MIDMQIYKCKTQAAVLSRDHFAIELSFIEKKTVATLQTALDNTLYLERFMSVLTLS